MHRKLVYVPALAFVLCAAATYARTPADPRLGGDDARAAQVKAQYEAAFEKGDHGACVALWRASPGLALVTIDADLEGSLKIAEAALGAETELQKKMKKRAVFGARAAAEALAHPLIADYAASFVAWDAQQQRQFRDGQSIYRKALQLLDKSEYAQAVRAGRECVERAMPLGDWWGAAMGYSVQGRAYQSAASFEDALAAYSMARLIQHDLALRDDEHETLVAMVDMLNTLERPVRGRETAERALVLARELGDTDSQRELLRRKAEFEDRLGEKVAAEATRRAIEALEK